jgi:hypothetical protein
MKDVAAGATGPNDPSKRIVWTGPEGQFRNQAEDNRDEIIKLLKSINKNVEEINAKLK